LPASGVADDGPGIPESRLAGMTARGARIDTTGAGLGLAIASDVAEAAGGSLALANAPDGLVATLALPAVPPDLTLR
jgi:signal transduction histidine kinase